MRQIHITESTVYKMILGLLLAIAIATLVGNIYLNERQKTNRARIDRIEVRVDQTTKDQVRDNSLLIEKNQAQIAQIKKVNDRQNQIIRALLQLKQNDPKLFAGVDLPTPAEFEDQVRDENQAVQAIQDSNAGSGSTGGASKPTKPAGGGSGPSQGGSDPDPTDPGPVDPGPVHPDPTPATPVIPEIPIIEPIVKPIRPIIDPVVEPVAPVIAPIVAPLFPPPDDRVPLLRMMLIADREPTVCGIY